MQTEMRLLKNTTSWKKNVSPRKKSLKVKEPSHHDVLVRKKPSQQEKKSLKVKEPSHHDVPV